jgi:hypothetical protein
MGSSNIQAYSDLLNRINKSPILNKMFVADSVEVDHSSFYNHFKFCRHFNISHDVFDAVREELAGIVCFSEGTLEEGETVRNIDEIQSEIILKLSFVDEQLQQFNFSFSIKELIYAEPLSDGSIKVYNDKNSEEITLKFYKLTVL